MDDKAKIAFIRMLGDIIDSVNHGEYTYKVIFDSLEMFMREYKRHEPEF